MAIYHLTAKIGSRSGGHSARAKAQYVLRLGPYARQTEPLAYAESGHMPQLASADPDSSSSPRDPTAANAPDGVGTSDRKGSGSASAHANALAYWTAADLHEWKKGRLSREVEVALPTELEPHVQRELVREFVPVVLAGEPLPYTLAIHGQDGPNPHCHILVSERVNDGIARPASQWFRRWNASAPDRGGARKTEALRTKSWLLAIREAWARLVNRALERAGFLERVDHRTLRAQGVDRIPVVHVGPDVRRMEARGLETGRGDLADHVDRRNDQIAERVSVRRRIDTLEQRESERREAPGSNGGASKNTSDESAQSGRQNRPDLAFENSDIERSDLSKVRSDTGEIEGPKPDDSAYRKALSHSRPRSERSAETVRSRTRSGRRCASRTRRSRPPRSRDLTPRDRPQQRIARGGSDRPKSARRERRGARSEPRGSPRSPRPRSGSCPGRGLRRGCPRVHPTEIGPTRTRVPRDAERPHCPGGGPPASRDGVRALRDRSSRLHDGPVHETRGDDPRGTRAPPLAQAHERAGQRHLHSSRARERRERARAARRSNSGGSAEARAPRPRPRGRGRDVPGNFQAWIRVAREVGEAERKAIARNLARQYEADPASGHAHPYGRLAGFTNRKTCHRNANGMHPYALLRGASGRVAPDGRALLREAARARSEPARSPVRARPAPDRSSDRPGAGQDRDAVELYRREMAALLRRTRDVGRADFRAAALLAARGLDAETIQAAMLVASPDLERRKPGHVEDYVRRTVAAAMCAHEREAGRDTSREEQELEP